MDRIEAQLKKPRRLLFAIAFTLFQVILVPDTFAQQVLQTNVDLPTGISCANSNNGTGHVLCLAEQNNSPLLDGFSWQPPGTTMQGPNGFNGALIEAVGKVDIMPNVSMPAGPFTGVPGCATSGDLSGTVICAIESPNNGLYRDPSAAVSDNGGFNAPPDAGSSHHKLCGW
jgi:hypothetical protein